MTADTPKSRAARALALLDLTNLEADCTSGDIDALCGRAVNRFGSVAAVCLWPAFVRQAADLLDGTRVAIATVVNFPHGTGDTGQVVEEARNGVADGAGEIDMVMDHSALMEGRPEPVAAQIRAVKAGLEGRARLKVILETGALATPERIRQAGTLAIGAGADFLKTSTGKIAVSATPEAARIMLETIRDGGGVTGFKAAGGIRTLEDANLYLAIADEILGPDWATPDRFRFGASGLLNALIAELEGASAPGQGDTY